MGVGPLVGLLTRAHTSRPIEQGSLMARTAFLLYFEHLPSSPRPHLPASSVLPTRKTLTRPVDRLLVILRGGPRRHTLLVLCTLDRYLFGTGNHQVLNTYLSNAHVDSLGSFHHCSLCF